MCGQHTHEILLEHGYSDADIATLVAERAVLDAPVAAP
jgi:crotonobetainyl-CoA:carnitine CoA-transferase CaiB-like acyl-CoA transferase